MKRYTLFAAVAILLLAAGLRFHLLEAQSFWNDEGNSARLSERSIPAILEGTASDVHPPLYYLLLRGWREPAGETEFGLRAFSAFAGVLVVAATIAIARHLMTDDRRQTTDDERTGTVVGQPKTVGLGPWSVVHGSRSVVTLAAGLLAAASPVLIYYSQETRMYALLALLAALSTWLLLLWLDAPRPARAAGYIALLAAGLYTHYFFPAVIAGQGLVVLLWLEQQGRAGWRRAFIWAGLVAAAGLLYLPWVPIFLRQVGGREGGGVGLLDYLARTGRWLALGPTLPAGAAVWAMLAATGLVVLGLIAGRRRAIVPLVMAGVPVAFSFVAGATDPAFFKFLLVSVPFLCVLGGLAFDRRAFGQRWGRAAGALAVVLLFIYLAGTAVSLRHLYSDPAFARADYRGMAARIAAEAHPNAAIILDAPNQWEAFTYYHRDGAPVFPLPKGQPDPAVVEPELEQIAAAHDRIYAIFWGEAQRDPERVVERWLDAHAFKAMDEWVGDVRFVVYAVPRGEGVFAAPADVAFQTPDGGTIRLVGYGARPEAVQPGDIVEVQLQWQADEPLDRPYKVFLHLVAPDGSIVAQRDSEPAGGARPTTSWAAGETVTDNHGVLVPYGTPPGEYTLIAGLYDAFDPAARLAVQTEGGEATSVPLATVSVR